MTEFSTEALVALVNRQTAMINAEVARYGEPQSDPRTPAYLELEARMNQALNETERDT